MEETRSLPRTIVPYGAVYRTRGYYATGTRRWTCSMGHSGLRNPKARAPKRDGYDGVAAVFKAVAYAFSPRGLLSLALV